MTGTPEVLEGDDLLAFVDIPPVRVKAIPLAQQFAEKLHAYTFPWKDRANTRVKDLVDMILILERGSMVIDELRNSLTRTFAQRATHPLPDKLAPPPEAWQEPYAAMAREASLATTDLQNAFHQLDDFWNLNHLAKS